jgi:hypothetical protein
VLLVTPEVIARQVSNVAKDGVVNANGVVVPLCVCLSVRASVRASE